jgi:hypothetical protein
MVNLLLQIAVKFFLSRVAGLGLSCVYYAQQNIDQNIGNKNESDVYRPRLGVEETARS